MSGVITVSLTLRSSKIFFFFADPYEDSQIEFEDSTVDDDAMDDDEDEEEENVDESVEDSSASASAPPPEDVAMIPLMVVPWATVPKNGVRPFCHVESCKLRFSSKTALAMHLATNHDNYIIDVSY